MSQHFYKTTYKNRPVEVVMGWDRPLQEYFLWVRYLDKKQQSFMWHNLDHDIKERYRLGTFLNVLAQFGISVPQTMILEVRKDGEFNTGNKQMTHL